MILASFVENVQAGVSHPSIGEIRENILVTKSGPIKLKSWFFITASGEYQKGWRTPTDKRVVKTGEQFGIAISFVGEKPKVRIVVKLSVPDSPEHFPCSSCKKGTWSITPDKKQVVIDTEIDGTKEEVAYYWGIDSSDPRGKFKIEMKIGNEISAAYDFEVQ